MPGLVCGSESLAAIWFHRRHSAPDQAIVRIGVSGDQFARPSRQGRDVVHKTLLQETLSVVLENDSVKLGEQLTDLLNAASLSFLAERLRSFAVDAHHLLLPCDDPGLDDGLKRGDPFAVPPDQCRFRREAFLISGRRSLLRSSP